MCAINFVVWEIQRKVNKLTILP